MPLYDGAALISLVIIINARDIPTINPVSVYGSPRGCTVGTISICGREIMWSSLFWAAQINNDRPLTTNYTPLITLLK